MAIDQEIQRKVDAYRGNPQQLMQRYQQNQQLVDLLALQKLKSEKEAAARDMQMKMQQQPGTIAQQREAELLDMTKQEMMQQTQGVLQQRQAQQQQNMQQVAQQGLGALANQRPAAPQPAAPQPAPQGAPQGQPMPRMAQGGIVAFAPGGYVGGVTQEDIDAYRANITKSSGQSGQSSRNTFQMSDEAIAQRIAASREPSSRQRNRAAARPGYLDRIISGNSAGPTVGEPGDSIGTLSGASRSASGKVPLETAPLIQRLEDQEGGRPDLLDPRNRIVDPRQPGTSDAETARMGQAPTTGGISTLGPDTAAGTPDAASSGIAGLGGGLPGLGGGGADAAVERGFQISDQYTGRAEKAGRYEDMESEMRALDAELYDPREERRDQLKAFLAGTANTTNFGSTMAGGTLAALNMRRSQKADRRKRLQDVFEMAERGMTLDTALAEGGLRLGQSMYSEAMANQRAALSAAASLRSSELRAEVDRAKLEYDKLKGNRSFGLQERELEIEQARNEATQALTAAENDTRMFGAVSLALDRVQDQEAAVREYVVEASQLPTLQDQLMMATDEEEAANIQKAIAAEEVGVAIRAEQIFDDMGGVETRDLLAAELLSFTGTGASMLSMEDIAGIEQLDGEE